MKDTAAKAGFAIVLLAVLLFGVKSCIVVAWVPPQLPVTYAIHGMDGRILKVTFLSKHKAIFVSATREHDAQEAILAEVWGDYGTHYFGRLWNIRPISAPPELSIAALWPYRVYPAGVRPVLMRINVQDKVVRGGTSLSLPNIGEEARSLFLFADDALFFQGMWLAKEETDLFPDLFRADLKGK